MGDPLISVTATIEMTNYVELVPLALDGAVVGLFGIAATRIGLVNGLSTPFIAFYECADTLKIKLLPSGVVPNSVTVSSVT